MPEAKPPPFRPPLEWYAWVILGALVLALVATFILGVIITWLQVLLGVFIVLVVFALVIARSSY